LEYVDDLGENVIKGHDRYSVVSTAALLWRSMSQNGEKGKGTNNVYYGALLPSYLVPSLCHLHRLA